MYDAKGLDRDGGPRRAAGGASVWAMTPPRWWFWVALAVSSLAPIPWFRNEQIVIWLLGNGVIGESATDGFLVGVDRVLRVRFDDELRNMSALDFITRIFVDGLGARYIVVGDDLRFGHDREGDFALVQKQGERYGYETMHTATLGISGTRVSSTRIREALENADFAQAEELLGRPYSITGKVVYGDQRGHGLGAPTANMELHRLRAPLSGVYVVEVVGIADQALPGVANVGTRPTIGDSIRANLEVHLLDFAGQLYGKTLTVTFCEKIRDEQKFESLDELQQQIHKDIAYGREFFKL